MDMLKRRFFRYTVQNIFAMIGLSVYILADTFYIARYTGSDGLTALNLTFPIYGVVYGMGGMLGLGAGTAYKLGCASGEDCSGSFVQSLVWCLALGLPFTVLGLLIPDRIIDLMGADEEITALAAGYVRIIMAASPLFMANYTFLSFVRNDHDSILAMAASLCGSLFNVVFDYLFLFVFDWGFQSAALATACCPALSIMVCSLHFLRKGNSIRLRVPPPSLSYLFRICALGFNAFVTEFSTGLTTFIFNAVLLGLGGNVAVAAYGIVANMAYVPMSVYGGVSEGCQPLLSEHRGKGDHRGVSRLLRLALSFVFICAVLIVGFCWLCTDGIVGILNGEGDAELASLGHFSVRLYSLGFLVSCFNTVLIGYSAATDNPKPSVIGSLMRAVVAIVPSVLTLSWLFGITGVWLSFLCAETLTLLVIGVILIKGRLREGPKEIGG